jgi:hypothetical protein
MQHFTHWTQSMFRGKPFPQLKGRAVFVKNAIPALLDFFTLHMDENNKQHREIKLGLKFSKKMDDIVSSTHGQNKLPPADAQAFLQSARGFLACNQALGSKCDDRQVGETDMNPVCMPFSLKEVSRLNFQIGTIKVCICISCCCRRHHQS